MVWGLWAEAEGGYCVFVREACCVMMNGRGGGVSDASDAEPLVCCHEGRGREMLGLQ